MGIKQWWGSIKELPQWGYQLQSLLTPTIGILAGALPIVPKIQWSYKTTTAYADRTNGVIVISSAILSDEAKDRPNKKANKELAVEAILGLVVHEGMHFVYSPETADKLLNPGLPVNEITCGIANIVEDVYIEYAAPLLDPSYGWMISAGWKYFLPANKVQSMARASWDGVDLGNHSGIVNAMACWKNQDFHFTFRTELEQELFGLLYSVRTMKDVQDRMDLNEKIIRMLSSEEELKKEFEKQQAEGEGDGEGDGEGKGMVFASDGKRVMEAAIQGGVEENAFMLPDGSQKFSDFGAAVQMPYLIKNIPPSVQKFAFSDGKKWSKLAEWSKDHGAVRTHRGVPGNYGRLTHPSRLLDDGKIFSKTQRSAPSGRIAEGGAPQTIFLVDLSGSMSSRVHGTYVKKYDAAVNVVSGAVAALNKAGHKTAVYGHTTTYNGVETCEIYCFKRFTDQIDLFLRKMQTVAGMGAQNSNADATAVEVCGQKFVVDGSAMRLFVISDGSPACYSYSGDTGNEITRNVVNKLRSRGVEVYSLCIDPDALEDCIDIYGPKNNFDVTDPKVADIVLKTVLG